MATPDPAKEDEQPLASACVRALMDRHGIPRHKQSPITGEILGISYSQAYRKVQKDSPWSLEELKRVAEHFGESLAELVSFDDGDRSQPAVLLVGGARVPCRVWVGSEVNQAKPGSLVAIRHSSEWIVVVSGEVTSPPVYVIRKLVIQEAGATRKKVAVLDDEQVHTDSLVDFLNTAGFDAVAFYSQEQLEENLKGHHFDAYLIDWLVGDRDTRSTIASIRKLDPNCPIGLLTGALDTGRAAMGEVVSAMKSHKLMFFEKPLRLPVIATQLMQAFLGQ
jgi:CheY-like chemotaxis protein